MSERISLAVGNPVRVEFDRHRTACTCRECTINCEHLPGYLIPSDLARFSANLPHGVDLLTWALDNLLASPGAIVSRGGIFYRVPTIVPARGGDDHCKFLAPNKLCRIHGHAPFGCAFFDAHQDIDFSMKLSARGLAAIYADVMAGGPYFKLWTSLQAAGKVSPPPEVSRQRLREAWDTELAQRGGR